MKTRILTYTGKLFDLADPAPELVCLADIAFALSGIRRFTGHHPSRVTVAEHSVAVRCLAGAAGTSPAGQLQALMHDASEAYLHDLSSPLKSALGLDGMHRYRELEERVRAAIQEHFSPGHPVVGGPPKLKEWDNEAFRFESLIGAWSNSSISRRPSRSTDQTLRHRGLYGRADGGLHAFTSAATALGLKD